MAATGRSGAGKTTLAKVVVGLLPATEGRVLIDGLDIRDIDPTSLRAQLAAVMQEDYVFAARSPTTSTCSTRKPMRHGWRTH